MSIFRKKDKANDNVISLRTEQYAGTATSKNFSDEQNLEQPISEPVPPQILSPDEVNLEFKEQLRKDIINDIHEIYDIVPKEKYLQEVEQAKDDLSKLENMVANEKIKFEQAKAQTSSFMEQMMDLTQERANKIFEDIMNGKEK